MKFYIASSWRNTHYPAVKRLVEWLGHTVLDWRQEETAFRWSQCSPHPSADWTMQEYRRLLYEERATKGFNKDFDLMRKADCCILLLPSGRSAHLEAGYFVGARKALYIYIPEKIEPELMYKFASVICLTELELENAIGML